MKYKMPNEKSFGICNMLQISVTVLRVTFGLNAFEPNAVKLL